MGYRGSGISKLPRTPANSHLVQPRLTKSHEFSGRPMRGNSRIEGTRPVRSGLPPPPSSPANLDKARTRAGFPYSFRGFAEVGCNTRRAGSAERGALSVPGLGSRFPGGAVAPTASQWVFRLRYSDRQWPFRDPFFIEKVRDIVGLSLHPPRSPGPTRHHGVLRSYPAFGASSSVRNTLEGSSVDRAGWATHGTWTRSSSPSRDSGTISGVPLSRWRRHRHPRPVASRPPGCQTLYPQAVEGPGE